ncbi:MAG: sulfotransferase family 2 domain-containing protein [bacterium]|nr:sulfotransferase family 2 domain-containing protein [bacterium]
MVSHQHRCIFVHIPKTAGTSIEKVLGFIDEVAWNAQDHRTIREVEPFAPHQLRTLLRRRDSYLLKRMRNRAHGLPMATAAQYREYFKFAFVRNSWSRVFSWYGNVMRDEEHRRRVGLQAEIPLKEFLLRYPEEWGLRTQLYWIADSRGDVTLDFVGRFENLDADFAHVCGVLGLPDRALPRLVAGDGRRYVDHYDAESIDIVRRRYAAEIARFGFEFGQ